MYVGQTIGFGYEKFKLVLDGAIANSADKREHRKDGNFTKKIKQHTPAIFGIISHSA